VEKPAAPVRAGLPVVDPQLYFSLEKAGNMMLSDEIFYWILAPDHIDLKCR
jgi:hypothetical protein